MAIVDRCLVLLARAARADRQEMAWLDAEVDRLRADLEARFGAVRGVSVH